MSEQEDIRDMKRLYPWITDEEALEAAENFRRYAAAVLRIYDYIRSDPERYRRFKELTAAIRDGSLDLQRSNLINPNATHQCNDVSHTSESQP